MILHSCMINEKELQNNIYGDICIDLLAFEYIMKCVLIDINYMIILLYLHIKKPSFSYRLLPQLHISISISSLMLRVKLVSPLNITNEQRMSNICFNSITKTTHHLHVVTCHFIYESITRNIWGIVEEFKKICNKCLHINNVLQTFTRNIQAIYNHEISISLIE